MGAQVWMGRMRLATSERRATRQSVERPPHRRHSYRYIAVHLVLLSPVVITFILHVHCPTHPRRPIVAQFRVYMNRSLAHYRPNNTIENNTQHSLCDPCGAVLVHANLPVPTGGSVVIHEQDNEQRNNGGRREGRSSTKRVVKLYK